MGVFYASPARWRFAILIGLSLVFAALDGPLSVLLLLTISVANFLGMRSMNSAKDRFRALWLWSLIGLNISTLAIFKYYNAFNRAGGVFTQFTSIEWPLPQLEWVLPLGLSYYVFQAIGTLVDQYTGLQKAPLKFSNYLLYLSYFPKLTAGPIERYRNFSEQLTVPTSLRYDHLKNGGRLILWGLFKKLFLSSHLSSVINPALDSGTTEGLPMLIVLFFYTVVIYLDVSAYTDIAIGCSRLFGIRLSENFNRPYLSTSIIDFWRRWHISLSSWVNDYIFRPLSLWLTLRGKMGRRGIYLALILSFLIIGLWHGADWNFAVFGAIHGTILCIETLSQRQRALWASKWKVLGSRWIQMLYVQLIFLYSCIFFRAKTPDEAWNWVVQSVSFSENFMASWLVFDGMEWVILCGLSLFLAFDQFILNQRFDLWCDRLPTPARWGLYAAMTYAIIAGAQIILEPFIYRGF